MKLTKSQLKQIIKEELEKVLTEGRVVDVEKTSIEGAESLMDPKYRVFSRGAPPPAYKSGAQLFTVTLAGGEKINAEVDDRGVRLYDLQDMEIDDEALVQEVLSMIPS